MKQTLTAFIITFVLKFNNIMKNQGLIFSNRQYKQIFIVLAIIPVLLLPLYFLLPKGFFSGLFAAVLYLLIYVPIMFAIHPKQYILKNGVLILNFLIRKNKVIAVEDITSIDVSGMKCLIIKYNKEGFVTPSSIKVIIPEIDLRVLQEELMKQNPGIEIVYK